MFISKFLHLKQIQTLANLTLNLLEVINITSPIIQQTGNDNTQAHQVYIIILI